jgi:methylenetetrahydrofolate reductase (NADPH)
MRTEDWDEFPNGRWGDSTSPAFGELSDVSHFYSFTLGSDNDRRAMLGHEPKVPQDVYEVFARYVEGDLPYIPWCETPLQPESFLIQRQLAELNRAGFLTVNSQPAVNGKPSTHKIFGWVSTVIKSYRVNSVNDPFSLSSDFV